MRIFNFINIVSNFAKSAAILKNSFEFLKPSIKLFFSRKFKIIKKKQKRENGFPALI